MVENILTIFIKEYRQLKRDKLSLAAIILVPTLMLILYGYALSFDVKHVLLGIVDESQTMESRNLAQKFFSSGYFDDAGNPGSVPAVDKYVQDNHADAVLVIPRDYAKELLLGRSVNVQVVLDGSNSNTATIIVGYVDGILQSYSATLTARYLSAKGLPIGLSSIDFRPRVLYNPELESMKYLVPGLVAFILMILTTLIPTISIVREKERGTMEHILLAPVSPLEAILGKTLLYFLLSLGATTMVIVVGIILFGIPVEGSVLLLSLVIVLFLISGLGIGILISTMTNSQSQAYIAATSVANLPNMILSGFIYPINSMPFWLQAITYVFPGRYFIASLRGVLLKGAGVGDIWDQLLPLLVFSLLIPLVASARMARKGI